MYVSGTVIHTPDSKYTLFSPYIMHCLIATCTEGTLSTFDGSYSTVCHGMCYLLCVSHNGVAIAVH